VGRWLLEGRGGEAGAYVEAGGLGGVDREEGDAAAPDVVFAAVEGDAQDGWGEDWRGAGRGRRGQGCVREEGRGGLLVGNGSMSPSSGTHLGGLDGLRGVFASLME